MDTGFLFKNREEMKKNEQQQFNPEISFFENWSSTSVAGTIPILDWVNDIKTGAHDYIVNPAREIGKDKDKDAYTAKKSKAPCVIYSYRMNGKRGNSYITDATGLFYYDIDVPFDINSIDKTKVFTSFRSFSNIGRCIIVKVSGLTTENYDLYYENIANELGIYDVVDKSAKGKSQVSVTTYDPELFLNTESDVFEYKTGELIAHVEKNEQKNPVEQPKQPILGDKNRWWDVRCRTNNCSDFITNGQDYQILDEKIKVVSVFFRKHSIKNGERNKKLYVYLSTYIWLNSKFGLTKEYFYSWFTKKSQYCCVNDLSRDELNVIFKNCWTNRNSFNPIPNKERKFLFKDFVFCYEEKMMIVRSNNSQSAKSKKMIYSFIEGYSGSEKITAKFVSENIVLSKVTVKRYWPEFKEYAREINLNNKK